MCPSEAALEVSFSGMFDSSHCRQLWKSLTRVFSGLESVCESRWVNHDEDCPILDVL